MRVVYLCEYPTLLGGERSLLSFLSATRDELDPLVVSPPTGRLAKELRRSGVAMFHPTGWPKGSIDSIAELINAYQPALIHANSLSMAEVATSLGKKTDRPAVVHVRDIRGLSARQWSLLQDVDQLVAVSQAVRQFLLEGGLDPNRVEVVGNGVDLQTMSTRWEDPLVGIARPRVACIGQIALRKGQDTFAEAACRAARSSPEANFLLVGERYSEKAESVEFEKRIHERTAELQRLGRWHHLGYREDVPALLSHVDLVVVPSRQEPLSRVALEALAAGTPVIATDVGGNREILDDGRLGRLVPASDPSALARAIEEAISDPALRARIAVEGPAWMAGRFSPQLQARRILGIYAALISPPREA